MARMATEHLTVDDKIRRAREAVRPKITQVELATALGITRQGLIDHEYWHKPLPKGLTTADAIEAIERIKARRAEQGGQS